MRIPGIVFGAILILALAYVLYVFTAYNRIEDHTAVEVVGALDGNADGSGPGNAGAGEEYTIVTYNIGFGAYSHDYTFFMDGGTRSWGKSKNSVIDMVNGAGEYARSFDPDFILFQEVDLNGTRSYHVNQHAILRSIFREYESTFGINYNSPFLFYPFYQPHGANLAGVDTFSRFDITSCERRSLPVSDSLSRIVDLDRAYTVSRIPVSNGKELILMNVHLSAYGGSPKVREGQTNMIRDELNREYARGNYVICGGDFNHDLKQTKDIETAYWAHYYDRTKIPEHFSFAIDLLDEEQRNALGDTCRDSGVVYDPDTTYTVILDGFIISDNIELVKLEDPQNGFLYSDHQPVVMRFVLNDD